MFGKHRHHGRSHHGGGLIGLARDIHHIVSGPPHHHTTHHTYHAPKTKLYMLQKLKKLQKNKTQKLKSQKKNNLLQLKMKQFLLK